MKRPLIVASLAGMALLGADVAYAQWLGPTLDAQRWDNLRRHQQRQRQKASERRNGTHAAPGLTLAERQAAWSRNKAEYRQRMLRDGKASADRWLDGIALQARSRQKQARH